MNPEDLMSIRNFGQKSYTELVDRLKLRKLVPDEAPVLAYDASAEGATEA
jgi:DNA-directed RNA polymerase alpha subunit